MLNISNENVTRLNTLYFSILRKHADELKTSGKKRCSCKTCLIKDKNGTLLIENNDVKERWLQYTKELRDDPYRSDSDYKMLDALDGAGVDDKYLRFLQFIYWKQKASVKVGNEETDNFDVKIGVPQGCVASLLPYNTFSEKIMQYFLAEGVVGQ